MKTKRFVRAAFLAVTLSGMVAGCDPIEPEDTFKENQDKNDPELVAEDPCDPVTISQIDKTIRTDVLNDGYRADLFIDGGVGLTARSYLDAQTYIDWTCEYFNSTGSDATNIGYQKECFGGSTSDLNGCLLYPDGAPRYKVIFVCGGSSTTHGESLGAQGRQAIVDFVKNGGAYTGSCAGAFISGNGYDTNYSGDAYSNCSSYLHLVPVVWTYTNYVKNYTDMTIESGSPILKYYDFGGDYKISSVYHNGGCYLPDESEDLKVLARYSLPGQPFNGKGCLWEYEPKNGSGRMVLCGSHPEGEKSGEKRDLMAAMLRYAADGRGCAKVKTILENGQEWKMNKGSDENDPSHAKIGDQQYHHFAVAIPTSAKKITVSLEGQENTSMELYMRKGTFAFKKEASYKGKGTDNSKTITLNSVSGGLYYIGVQCTTAPKNNRGTYGIKYVGDDKFVLNGAEYSIKVSWE